ncbi:MAG TPA: hypothetical protein VI387_14170, partial [Candidatus Brocadiales bacterium]|nr:hypothetical protein [Candidatus Brocadiales bacterium]
QKKPSGRFSIMGAFIACLCMYDATPCLHWIAKLWTFHLPLRCHDDTGRDLYCINERKLTVHKLCVRRGLAVSGLPCLHRV